MTDPRKPVHRPQPAQQEVARLIALNHLLECTERGSKEIGCSGASFVILGLGIWASELAELDPKATAQLLSSLGDLYDPAANHTKKLRAEKRRRAAVYRLFAALDTEMAPPAGNA